MEYGIGGTICVYIIYSYILWMVIVSIFNAVYIYTIAMDMFLQTGGGMRLYRIEFSNNAHAFAYIHTCTSYINCDHVCISIWYEWMWQYDWIINLDAFNNMYLFLIYSAFSNIHMSIQRDLSMYGSFALEIINDSTAA